MSNCTFIFSAFCTVNVTFLGEEHKNVLDIMWFAHKIIRPGIFKVWKKIILILSSLGSCISREVTKQLACFKESS